MFHWMMKTKKEWKIILPLFELMAQDEQWAEQIYK